MLSHKGKLALVKRPLLVLASYQNLTQSFLKSVVSQSARSNTLAKRARDDVWKTSRCNPDSLIVQATKEQDRINRNAGLFTEVHKDNEINSKNKQNVAELAAACKLAYCK